LSLLSGGGAPDKEEKEEEKDRPSDEIEERLKTVLMRSSVHGKPLIVGS
jgi:hypothetical protein